MTPPIASLPRIRQELDKLPLTEDQKNEVAPNVLKNAAFLDTAGGRNSVLRIDSAFFDFAGKINAVEQQFEADGMARGDYLAAALKQQPLFTQSPETVARNITGVVDHFAVDGLTRKEYLHAALMHPALFCMKPATIADNITGAVDRFADNGLTRKEYLKAALRQPPLFSPLARDHCQQHRRSC